jgi:hypothetical protein
MVVSCFDGTKTFENYDDVYMNVIISYLEIVINRATRSTMLFLCDCDELKSS